MVPPTMAPGETMAVRLTQVDAFTDRPFGGNPAAVVILAEPADEGWMQAVAREMNLSETAFLHPEGDGFRLRWFTPTVEVDLCGHATLASAHVLWDEGHLEPGQDARFHTRGGTLTATRRPPWIEMDFPAEPPKECPAPPALLKGLGVRPSFVGRNRLDYLVEVTDEGSVKGLVPDLARLRTVPYRGTMVTAPSDDPRYDFVSRYFAPRQGIDEDPVTGSAHCCLGPYWGEKLGRDYVRGHQVSARGGVVGVRLAGPRVKLEGQAVTVLRGQLLDGPPPGVAPGGS